MNQPEPVAAELAVTPPTPHPLMKTDVTPAAVYLASLLSGSRPVVRSSLRVLAVRLGYAAKDALRVPWHLLQYENVMALRSWLAETYAPATGNRYLAIISRVLHHSYLMRLLKHDTLRRIAEVPRMKGIRLLKGRAIAMGELEALFRAARSEPKSALRLRHETMLSVLYGCGVRRAELVALNVEDFSALDGSLRIQGKGDKHRLAYLPRNAKLAVEDWIALRGAEKGPLLTKIERDGTVTGERLGTQVVFLMLRRLARAAGVTDVSPHDFRRTFISDLLDAGVDIVSVQKLVGHSETSTTARYDRRGERAKARAVEHIHVPYVRAA